MHRQQQGTRHWEDVSSDDVKAFLGVLIGMGVHRLPGLKYYWSTDPFFRVQGIADVLSRNRFMKILNNLHIAVANNSKAVSRGSPGNDKLHKVRPLVTELNRSFQENGVPTYSQSIDEAMVLFKGRSSIRQYMPMKPTKRGYKVWVRADSKSGYVYQFEVYTGKGDSSSDGVGLGERVVKNLTESLNNTNTHVCFDNFFASVALLQYLSEQKIFATCTIRSNR